MSSEGRRPSVEQVAQSMLFLYGAHDDDHDHAHGDSGPGAGTWAKAPSFADDPQRAAAIAEASRRDRERYLNEGLTEVACRFCHTTVEVKKYDTGYTAVQWNSRATDQCAYFAELRAEGGDPSRAPACPRLHDSINHAVAEGVLETRSEE
ncbi:hypothetical protein [Mycolicibacillus trivialis]|uniref:Ferredoxin n=1 Tax=Mycolicibacillus trivialis TaxID=1798 RepID=A0A1X2EHN4_9MYCO|nr:hypothetical protein [Mycolicibacillus trivialis]ORX02425.1 hypothetical protein AWC30_12685 [Mycolicibacillus trivialis]